MRPFELPEFYAQYPALLNLDPERARAHPKARAVKTGLLEGTPAAGSALRRRSFTPPVPLVTTGAGAVPANAVERALADLWARTAPAMPAGWRQRFLRAVGTHGAGPPRGHPGAVPRLRRELAARAPPAGREFFGTSLQRAGGIINELVTSRLREFECLMVFEFPGCPQAAAIGASTIRSDQARSGLVAHVEALRDWMAGEAEWEQRTGRHTRRTPAPSSVAEPAVQALGS